jgi:hypothetical protein
MPGPAPKPDSKRRRYNKPASYGEATATTAPAATPETRDLNIGDEHPFVTSMWDTVQESCEAQFYSAADWQRVRLEPWHLNQILTGAIDLTAANWQRVQSGFDELLISPAVKRRAGIEMTRQAADVDEVEAVSLVGKYRQQLKSV